MFPTKKWFAKWINLLLPAEHMLTLSIFPRLLFVLVRGDWNIFFSGRSKRICRAAFQRFHFSAHKLSCGFFFSSYLTSSQRSHRHAINSHILPVKTTLKKKVSIQWSFINNEFRTAPTIPPLLVKHLNELFYFILVGGSINIDHHHEKYFQALPFLHEINHSSPPRRHSVQENKKTFIKHFFSLAPNRANRELEIKSRNGYKHAEIPI